MSLDFPSHLNENTSPRHQLFLTFKNKIQKLLKTNINLVLLYQNYKNVRNERNFMNYRIFTF